MVLYDVAQLEMSKYEEVILVCNPVFKEREEMVCILPTQMMLEDAYSLAEAMPTTDQKSFQKSSLSVELMDSFLFRETLSHPLLMPLIEDPKMELKTFLLPLRLGLLTAFHQSAEVNIFTI